MKDLDSDTAAIRIVLPDGTVLERRTDIVTAIKVLDFLTKSVKSIDTSAGLTPAIATTAPSIKHATAPPITKKYRIPNRAELLRYIRSRPDYSHSVEDIIREFVGEDVLIDPSMESERLKNAVRSKLPRIRDEIEKQENGRWEEGKSGPFKVFWFIKSNDLSKYEEHESDK